MLQWNCFSESYKALLSVKKKCLFDQISAFNKQINTSYFILKRQLNLSEL
jgi:hypothetical protein